jgi:glyoxylase-like metal-dependent hydrolase (beta-lactamase superfamily II)
MLKIELYCGGICETNAWYLPQQQLLVDAPEGVAAWLRSGGRPVRTLLLTHGHFDHTWDGAALVADHHCSILCHPETAPMISDPNFFARLGLPWTIAPFPPTRFVREGDALPEADIPIQVLDVPGHCPGSLAFYLPDSGVVFAGDTLLASGICRTDLPGGNWQLLLAMIRDKLLTLPEPTKLLAGHGPASTIGEEKRSNPYIAGL